MSELKEKVAQTIEENASRYVQASHDISAKPELQNQEFYACERLTTLLKEDGFQVKTDIAGHATGFIAQKGTGARPAIVYLAEYDALPEIGHGCGHNVIGTLSSLAGVGLGAALKTEGNPTGVEGTVYVYGTPAEEGGDNGSAKASFANAGLFKEVDAALLLHPASENSLTKTGLAVNCYAFEFFGKTSHAAAAPEKGINALDALLLFFNGINALRQQCTPDCRIHGVITHGGDAPNVIPHYTQAKFFIRANKTEDSRKLLQRVINIAEGSAIATGCTYKATSFNNEIEAITLHPEFDALFAEVASQVGLDYTAVEDKTPLGSSDVGNVSSQIPTIQPTIQISETKIEGHTLEFAQAAISPLADKNLVLGAKALALTGLKLLEDPATLKTISR